MAGGVMAASLSQVFMGVMLKPMVEDLGWTRTEISGAVTLGTLLGGFMGPWTGRFADRHGPRLISTVGVIVLSIALFAMAFVNDLWHLYVIYVIGRSFSQTVLAGDVPRTTAVNWFRRMRGRALGMTQMALPLGNSGLAIIAQLMMGNGLDWRTVFIVFSISSLVILLLPAILILRRRPEDFGLLPDGDVAPNLTDIGSSVQVIEPPQQNWTLRAAIRTSTLWILIAALTIGITANGAIGFHLIAYLTDKGLSPTLAVTALSVYAISGALANGLWGIMLERFPERLLAAGSMAVASLLCFALISVTNGIGAMAFAVLFGLAARAQSAIVMLIVAKYFGRQNFGAISGFVAPFQMMGLGFGPLWASVIFDSTGSYTYALLLVTLGFAMSAILLWNAKRPKDVQVEISPVP